MKVCILLHNLVSSYYHAQSTVSVNFHKSGIDMHCVDVWDRPVYVCITSALKWKFDFEQVIFRTQVGNR